MARLDPEFEKKERKKEAKRVRRIGDPTPQQEVAAAIKTGVKRVGSTIADTSLGRGVRGVVNAAAQQGASGAFQKEQVSTPQAGPAVRPVALRAPKEEAAIDPTSPDALRISFLGQQGINDAARGQDPSQFNLDPQLRGRTIRGEEGGVDTLALRTSDAFRSPQRRIGGDTPRARLGQELLTNTDQVNLGNFGTEGGPDIFGRASEPGGRINTFAGAGTADLNAPSTQIGDDRTARIGGRLDEGFRSTSVDSTLQAGIDAFKLRAASGGNIRAGSRGFRGGAASGGGNDVLRQVTRINSRADKAFQQAIAQGMNTKAAARIAGSIRDSASQINFQDRTAAGERNTAASLASSERTAAIREQGELRKLGAEQEAASGDAFIENLRNLHGTVDEDTGEFRQNPQSFSQAIFAAGGERAVRGLSQSAGFAAFQQGSNIAQILANVNQVVSKNGKRFDNIQDLLDGGNALLAQTGVTILDALKDDTIDITDIFSQKITLGDGTNIELGDFFGDATLTNRERAALIEIIGQKKKDR